MNKPDDKAFLALLCLGLCLVALIIMIVAAIVSAMAAYTAPYPFFVFVVPIAFCGALAYGTSFLLFPDRRRRRIAVALATAAGSIAFLIAVSVIAGGLPILRNPGALLSALGLFAVFGAGPVIGVVLVLALCFDDVRAALRGETLVDLDALPESLRRPIEPYLATFEVPAWRRFSIACLLDPSQRHKRRIAPGELEALYAQATRLAEHGRGAAEAQTRELRADAERLRTDAARILFERMAPHERGLFAATLAAEAVARLGPPKKGNKPRAKPKGEERTMSDRKRQNPYARTRTKEGARFEEETPNLPAVRAAPPVVQGLPPLNGNRVPIYRPHPNHTFVDRWDGGGLRRDFHVGEGVLKAATQYNHAETEFERSQRELDKERLRGSLVLPEIMAEQQKAVETVLNGKHAIIKAQHRLAKLAVDLEREQTLSELDYQIETTNRLNELKEAQARQPHIDELTGRSVDVALAKSDVELWRSRSDAEGYKKKIRDLQAPPPVPKPEPPPEAPKPEMPEVFARHIRTEEKVTEVQHWAKPEIEAIESRARAEGRDFTPEEIERLDQLRNALAASESELRRSGASDVR